MGTLKRSIKKSWAVLKNPQKEFEALANRSFEKGVAEYIVLLLSMSIVAGIAQLVLRLGHVTILDYFFNATINYWYMLNYAMGLAFSTGFLYAFLGTFILIIAAAVLKPFFKRHKFTRFLHILFYSMSPFLLFAWIPLVPYALSIWTVFLLVIGIRTNYKTKKTSIDQRD